MFKITATIATALFLGSGWLTGHAIPRFTHSAADYVLMPLIGYLVVIVAAHCAVRLLPKAE